MQPDGKVALTLAALLKQVRKLPEQERLAYLVQQGLSELQAADVLESYNRFKQGFELVKQKEAELFSQSERMREIEERIKRLCENRR